MPSGHDTQLAFYERSDAKRVAQLRRLFAFVAKLAPRAVKSALRANRRQCESQFLVPRG